MTKVFEYNLILLLLFYICCVQCQRYRYDDGQQAQVPVGKINLKDFGIDKTVIKDERISIEREAKRVQSQAEIPKAIPTSSRGETDCSNCADKRYLQHYTARGCRPVTSSSCNCPVRYICPDEWPVKNHTVCNFGGRVYQIGSRLPVKNPCRMCDCRDASRRRGQLEAEIDCGIGIECPEIFGVKPPRGCYNSYEWDSCCGQTECPNKSEFRTQKVCNYKGRQYKLGQKIYLDEDPCKTCICSDDWNDDDPINSIACRSFDCEMELNRDFREGCTPIYHEGTCCPIEYHCPKTFTTSTQSATHCVFDGRKYPIGSKLSHSNVCVDCTCRVPPDFTCVHKSCPAPDASCFVAKWDNSVCCQKYVCERRGFERDESNLRGGFNPRS